MATKYYLQSTNAYTTCDAAQAQDMSLSVGSSTASATWGFASYQEILTFDIYLSSGMAASNSISASLSINTLTASSTVQFRVQQIDDSGCAVLNSSSYSSVYTTTGTKTETFTLAWTGTDGILRLSVEMATTAPPFPAPTLTIDCNSSSYLDVTPSSNVSRRMYLVRDNWWLNSSGAAYITNETNQLSAKNVGLYRAVGDESSGSDTTYIKNHTSVGGTYYFRITNDHVVPDRIKVNARGLAGSGGATDLGVDLYINGVIFPNAITITDHASAQDVSQTIILTDYQRKGILNGRTNEYYDFCALNFSFGDSSTKIGARLYSVQIYYENNDYVEYLNHRASVPGAIALSLFPIAQPINCNWQTDAGVTFASGDSVLIQQYASGVDADTRYIRCVHEPYLSTFSILPSADASIANSYSLQSGNLTLHFEVGSGLGYNTQLNRANLYLRMSLPPSATVGNYRDTYEVHGVNPTLYSGGNIMWGGGSIVEQSGFRTYTTELCWLDPRLYSNVPRSGDISHPYFRTSESVRSLQLKVFGIPSGAYLSAAELRLEAQNDEALNLYTSGVIPTSGISTQNLYTYGGASGATNTLNLYTYGKSPSTGNLNLYVQGSATANSSGINLFTQGGNWAINTLPLTVGGRVFPSATKQMNMYVYSTTNSGIRDDMNLVTSSLSDPGYTLPLYINGYDSANTNILPLVINGEAAGARSSVNLIAYNVYSSATKTLRLMIANTGINYSGTLPLFINRGNESLPGTLPLFVKVIDGNPSSGNLNLVMKTHYSTPIVFNAIGDSYIDSSNTSTNYGTNQYLKVTKG